MKKTILLLFALILAACSTGADSELDRNLSKWQDSGVNHYRFQLGVGCFCPVGDIMPLTVEVLDGEVVSIMDVNGEPYSSTDPMSDFILKYATIDRIFSELGSDAVQEADALTITYDPVYGYPVDVTIDYIELAADDELYLSVSGFEPLP